MNQFTKTCLVLAVSQAIQVNDALSATIVVNTTVDIDGGGPCTLREAIVSLQDADTGSSGCEYSGLFGVDDTVNFDPGLSGQTITLTQADELRVTSDLTINGLGRDLLTIDGMNNAGVFKAISTTTNLTINDLTITDGSNSSIGGGITSSSILNLNNCIVSGNTSGTYGGGIHSAIGDLSLSNTIVSDNYSSGRAGGINFTRGNLTVVNSTISGNTANGRGGGIYLFSASMTMSNSTVVGNTATEGGGGIRVLNSGIGGATELTIDHSSVSGNTSSQEGGGIAAYSFENGNSNVSVNFSTISNNSSLSEGGGIHIKSAGIVAGTVSLNNSTVSGNYADSNGGGLHSENSNITAYNTTFSDNHNGAVHLAGSYTEGTASFVNTILANSIARPDCYRTNGIVSMLNGNIIETDSMVPETNCASPSALKGDPGLGSLANNGGPTQTHALLPNSIAIAAGITSESCEMPDQRGVERVDGVCDIGAYTIDRSGFFVIPLANGKVVVIPN